MSDVSGIPYMGPMGTGNFFAPQFSYNPQLSAGQISAPYAGPSAYSQNIVNNLFSSGGGFGAQTDYYSQLAANQLSALTPNTFNMSNAGSGLTIPQLQQPWLTPEGGVNNVFSGGGGYAAPPPPPPQYTDPWAGTPYGTGGGGGLGGGGPSAYDYGSLFGGGAVATPPSAYDYGSLYGGGGLGGLGGGGQADPFPGMAMPGGLGQPMAQPSMGYDYGSLFGRGGGGQADPFPGMAMPGGLGQPMAQPSMGYDYGSLFGRGGGIGGLGGGQADPFPGMAMPGGLNQPMAQPSLYGGGGNSLGGRLAQALGGVDPAWPAAQRNAGLVGPTGSAFDFNPSVFQRGYGNEGGFSGDPNWGGFGQGGRDAIGGGVYDPFNVGRPLDPSLYGPGGLGGGRGGGLFQGGFPGVGGTQTPDIQRLLGYTPDLQLGISGLQKTLQEIDAATARGDRGMEPGFWERAIPDPGSTLSPQDRQIRFGGGGFRDPSFFAPGGLGGDTYTNPGLPLEITQGGSTPGGALFSDFNRSLRGDAPAYPAGVVGGPYALPDITPQRAQDLFGGGGGPFPYTNENPFAGLGLPPEITRGASSSGGGGGGDNRFMLPDVTNEERTFPMLDSPDIRDRIAFGGGIGPASRLYSDADLAPGLRTQQLLKAPYNSTNFNELNQAYLLDQQRAQFGQQLQANPAMLKTVLALAPAEMGKGNTDEAYQTFFESFLNRGAAYSTDLNPSAPKNVPGRAPGLVDLMSDPEILGGRYYEPINKGKMQPHLDSLNDPNDPENFDRLNNILNRVLAGSNVGNLPLGNSSYGGKANPSMGPGSILPQFGGDYGMYFPVPGSAGEYLTSKLNPYNNPQARNFIGAGNQAGNRAWWMNLMPIGSAPWAMGGR